MSDQVTADAESIELLVGRVADEYVERLARDEPADVEEYAARHPQIADMLRRVLPALHVMGTSCPTPAMGDASAPDVSTGRPLGDYRIIREVGRGGMGIVYEAEQVSLGRRVALKVLPFAAVMDNRQLQRFKVEAQAAAQLHHTHILPVHSVGCERGVHFYAMQFVEGHSLAEIVHELRRISDREGDETVASDEAITRLVGDLSSGRFAPPPSPIPGAGSSAAAQLLTHNSSLITHNSTRDPAYVRSIARLAIQAAEALDHAHEHGIVHRDVKPSNLLLDNDGTLWVTDFGLALTQSDTGMSLTQPGDLLGTLRYMSPEQASGKRVPLDCRSDVYSLGVTLYELLTLEPAFTGTDRQQLLRKIGDEEPRPLRRLNDAVPADLETIVLKATEKEAAQRYDTAQELADDLRRFLDDKPIHAKRPSLVDRGLKWSRRHRSVVAAAAVVLVVAVIALSVSTVMIAAEQVRTAAALAEAQVNAQAAQEQRDEAQAARGREAEQREQTDAQRQRAEDNYHKTRDFVDVVLMRMAEELDDMPKMERVRRDLLEQALTFYQGFLTEKGDDPDVRQETGHAYHRVGKTRELLGQRDDAENAYGHSIALFRALAADFPNVSEYRADVARALSDLGTVLRLTGRPDEAEQTYREALTLQEKLLVLAPATRDVRGGRADTFVELGQLLYDNHRSQEADVVWRKAADLYGKLTENFPDVAGYRRGLADACAKWALVANELGRIEEAKQTVRRSVELSEALVADFPDRREYRSNLAESYRMLFLLDGDPLTTKEEAARRAVEIDEQLSVDFPNVPRYREYLGVDFLNLGDLLYREFGAREAQPFFDRAVETLSAVVAECPDVQIWRAKLNLARRGLREVGFACGPAGEWKLAVEVLEKLADVDFREERGPGDFDVGERRGPADWFFLSIANAQLGDQERARYWRDRTVTWLEDRSADDVQGEIRVGIEGCEAEIAKGDEGLEIDPDDYDSFSRRAEYLAYRGVLRNSSSDYELALRDLARCVDLKPEQAFLNMFRQGYLRLALGDLGSYRKTCEAMLSRFGDAEDPDIANCVARTCSLAPAPVADPPRVVELAELALAGKDGSRFRSHSWFNTCTTLGLALYRAGRFEEARELLAKPLIEGEHGHFCGWLVMAMVQHKLGGSEEARRWLKEARIWAAPLAPGLAWWQRMEFQILRQETEELIEGEERVATEAAEIGEEGQQATDQQ